MLACTFDLHLSFFFFPFAIGASWRVWPGNCSRCVGKIYLFENGDGGNFFVLHYLAFKFICFWSHLSMRGITTIFFCYLISCSIRCAFFVWNIILYLNCVFSLSAKNSLVPSVRCMLGNLFFHTVWQSCCSSLFVTFHLFNKKMQSETLLLLNMLMYSVIPF